MGRGYERGTERGSTTPPPGGVLSRRRFIQSGVGGASLAAAPAIRAAGSAQASALDRLRAASASVVCDALARLGHDRDALTLRRDVRPVFASTGAVVGPAVTTRYEQRREAGTGEDIRRFVFEPVDAAPAGAVWVIASGTDRVLSMLGELIALAARRRGLAGVVTDGGCRDIESMERIGLPVFSRGSCLHGPGSHIRPVAANEPIVCGGVEVRPGDIIVADRDGVVLVPQPALDEVARVATQLLEREGRTRRLIEAGGSLVDSYRL